MVTEETSVTQCEALTKRNRRCQRPGEWDGYHALVLCPIHLNYYETVLVESRRPPKIPIYAGQSIEERL